MIQYQDKNKFGKKRTELIESGWCEKAARIAVLMTVWPLAKAFRNGEYDVSGIC